MFTLVLIGGVCAGWWLNNQFSNIGSSQKKALKAGISGATAAVQNKIDNLTSKSK